MKQIMSIVALTGLFAMTACNGSAVKEKDAALQAQQHTIDSMNNELAKKKVIDSMNEVTKTQYVLSQPINTASTSTPVSSASRSTHNSHSSRTTSHTSTTSQSQPVVYQEAPAPKKKGWSAKAKGAVIGTAAGAATGAIVNGRNRAAGAVIGGILGAGAGTGVGAIIDKKNGR